MFFEIYIYFYFNIYDFTKYAVGIFCRCLWQGRRADVANYRP